MRAIWLTVAVWPGVTVRLCQFHIVQAIIRWTTDARVEDLKGKDRASPQLCQPAKVELMAAFRRFQRLRISPGASGPARAAVRAAAIEAAKTTFYAEVERIVERWYASADGTAVKRNRSGNRARQAANSSQASSSSSSRDEQCRAGGRPLAKAQLEAKTKQIRKYFERNWFNEFWLRACEVWLRC